VGAIAILLLFVLKLLNIRLAELKDNSTRYVPVGLLIGLILFIGLNNNMPTTLESIDNISNFIMVGTFTNLEIIGLRLFEDLGVLLIVAGIILFLAMVGAIVLTLGHEGEIKRQDIFDQIQR
jgi:NADH-quinone oxidoreductase subunit J